MKTLRILLVDDDPEFVRHFRVLGEDVFETRTASNAEAALEALKVQSPDAVLLDVDLGEPRDGIDLLSEIRKSDPELPVIMVSGDEDPRTVVRAMRAGADDYVSKSPSLEVLRLKVSQALDSAAWKIHARQIQCSGIPNLIGSSEPMRRLREEIAQVARRNLRVLVRGETGTGKELVAAAIHSGSPRRSGRFVTISGAVGPDQLFDSELLGHERGAFTGAEQRRRGKFEIASGGTLFLDEIDRLSPGRQAKLLRVVESGEFERLGGSASVRTDVRLVSATNADLEAAMESGEFLPDLYFRVAEYELHVPPLRERLEDIPELVEFLLARYANGEGIPKPEVSEEAVEVLRDHRWCGNVRELDAVLKRALVFSSDDVLNVNDMRQGLRPVRSRRHELRGEDPPLSAFLDDDYADARSRLERAFDRMSIERALGRAHGNVTRAASRLGLSRATLHRKIGELGLNASRSPADDD